MAEELQAMEAWTERPIDELADRYGSFYGRLVELYRIAPENAAHMSAALIGAEQMPRFEALLPEIEEISEFEFSIEEND